MQADGKEARLARWRRRRRAIAALGLAALAVVVFLIVKDLGDEDEADNFRGPEGDEFTIERPSGWEQASDEELAALPGSPLAVVRRTDGKGIIVVNRQSRASRDFAAVSRRLDRQLKRRIPDFRKVNARTVRIKAGAALLYLYVRQRRGTAHSVVVVPVGSLGYTLHAVVPAGAPSVAHQVGTMIRSFDA